MSKITDGGLTQSGTGCFYSCNHTATVGVKGLVGDGSIDVVCMSEFVEQLLLSCQYSMICIVS